MPMKTANPIRDRSRDSAPVGQWLQPLTGRIAGLTIASAAIADIALTELLI
jgi:hypothetical protein